jgi:hypothetical protein
MLRLGGPEPHGRRSGVVHVVADSEQQALERGPAPGHRCSARHGTVDPTRSPTSTSAGTCRSRPSAPTTCTRSSPACSTRAPRSSCTPMGAEHRHHAGPPRRPLRRRHRQQPAAPRRLPRLGGGREGRALRAHVRRLRRPARRRRRRPGIPARRRPGVGRRRAPRREAAARLRRGHRASGDAGDPQGLRRGVHRDELPRAGRDPGAGLAGRARSPSWARSPPSGSCTGASWPSARRTCVRRSSWSSPTSTTDRRRPRDRAVQIGVVDEIVAPDRTRTVQLGGQVALGRASASHRGTQAVLRHEDVAVHPGDGVEHPECGGEGVAAAFGGGGRLLGHLETQVLPAAQGRGEGGSRPDGSAPGDLGAEGAGCHRLRRPLHGYGHAKDAGDSPLDMRAQRRRGGVDEQHSTGRHRSSFVRGTSSPTASDTGRLGDALRMPQM